MYIYISYILILRIKVSTYNIITQTKTEDKHEERAKTTEPGIVQVGISNDNPSIDSIFYIHIDTSKVWPLVIPAPQRRGKCCVPQLWAPFLSRTAWTNHRQHVPGRHSSFTMTNQESSWISTAT